MKFPIRTTIAAVVAIAALNACTQSHAAPTPHAFTTVQACPTEDSTDCYWDADSRGNGKGHSFYADAQGKHATIPASSIVSTAEINRLIAQDAPIHGYLFTVNAAGDADAWLFD